jgi:hypothetical protein
LGKSQGNENMTSVQRDRVTAGKEKRETICRVWACSAVVECLPSMQEAQTERERREKEVERDKVITGVRSWKAFSLDFIC